MMKKRPFSSFNYKLIFSLAFILSALYLFAIENTYPQDASTGQTKSQTTTTTLDDSTGITKDGKAYDLKKPWILKMELTKFSQGITEGVYNRFKENIDFAKTKGAKAFLLELNNPGGELGATQSIKNLLNQISQTDMEVLTFVNGDAFSAAAIISLASNKIAMAPGGAIGDAQPIMYGPQGIVEAPEKIVSPVRSWVRSLCEKNNRPTRVCEAMVDVEIELTVERDGIRLERGKLLTLTTEEAKRVNIIDFITSNEAEALKAFGYEAVPVYTKEDLQKTVNIIEEIGKGFQGNTWLWILTIVLLILGITGIIIEIATPGFGVPGTIGVLSLAGFFIIQSAVFGGPWWVFIIFLLGIVLLIAEIFFIPGFGVSGVAGILFIIASLVFAFGVDNITTGLLVVLITLVVTTVIIFIAFRYLPENNNFKRLTLQNEARKEEGFTVAIPNIQGLLHMEGISLTSLRPSGTARIDNRRWDVVSAGEFIDKDKKIVVVQVDGNRIVVDRKKNLKDD